MFLAYIIEAGVAVEWHPGPTLTVTYDVPSAQIKAGAKISSQQVYHFWTVPQIEQGFGVKVAEHGAYSAWPPVPPGHEVVSRGATVTNGVIVLTQTTQPQEPVPVDSTEMMVVWGKMAIADDAAAKEKSYAVLATRTADLYPGRVTYEEARAVIDNLTVVQRNKLIEWGLLLP